MKRFLDGRRVRGMIFHIWKNLPFGYLLRFNYGEHRITLCKNLWVVVDGGKGTSADSLPLPYVSPKLIDECAERLAVKYKLSPSPPNGGPIDNFLYGWGIPGFGADKAHYWWSTFENGAGSTHKSECGIRVTLRPDTNPMLGAGTFTKCAKCIKLAPSTEEK